MAKKNIIQLMLVLLALAQVFVIEGQGLPDNNDGTLVEDILNQKLKDSQAGTQNGGETNKETKERADENKEETNLSRGEGINKEVVVELPAHFV